MRLQLFFVACLLQSALSTPIGPETSLSKALSLDIPDSIARTAYLSTLNASTTANNSLLVPHFLPHRFKVPTTDTVLDLGFGIIRHRIDMANLHSLILYAKATVIEGMEEHGVNALYPTYNTNVQQFSTLGINCKLWVRNLRDGERRFTWGQLYNVVEGLRLYLVQGGRNYETRFAFANSGPRLGHGRVYNMVDSESLEVG